MLTYTVWCGTDANSINTKGVSSSPTKQGNSVTITQTGLNKDTTYYFKVVVSDTTETTISSWNKTKTYCEGEYCSGGFSSEVPCTKCGANGYFLCTDCGERGWFTCDSCSARK